VEYWRLDSVVGRCKQQHDPDFPTHQTFHDHFLEEFIGGQLWRYELGRFGSYLKAHL
jgi:hypothetical protein